MVSLVRFSFRSFQARVGIPLPLSDIHGAVVALPGPSRLTGKAGRGVCNPTGAPGALGKKRIHGGPGTSMDGWSVVVMISLYADQVNYK